MLVEPEGEAAPADRPRGIGVVAVVAGVLVEGGVAVRWSGLGRSPLHQPCGEQHVECWADDTAAARKTVHEIWPNAGIPGQLSQDLPTWSHFEEAAGMVSEDDATEHVPCGPRVEPVLESVQAYLDAGYDHLYFHQIGPDQDGFLDFWSRELRPALSGLGSAAGTPAAGG